MKTSSLIKYLRFGAVAVALSALALTARAQFSTAVSNLNPLVYYRLNDPPAPAPFADEATNLGSPGTAVNGYYVAGASHPDTSSLEGAMTAETSINGGIVCMPYQDDWASSQVFAAEMWFNVNPGIAGVLCCNVNMDGRWGWILYYNEDGTEVVSLRLYNGNGSTVLALAASPTNIVDSVWHHVVAQADGTNAYVYIDGTNAAEIAETGYVGPSIAHACPFNIFGRPDNDFKSVGLAGQVAIYTNTLSPAQILNHWNIGTNTSPAQSYASVVLADGAQSYWPLNDPAFNAPTFPTATNYGTLGTTANGTYQPGTTPGVAGPSFAGLSDGGACLFNGMTGAFAGDTTGSLLGNVDISASGGIDDNSPSNAITIMAWIQSDGFVNDFANVVSQGDSSWRVQRGPSGGNGTDLQFGLNNTTGGFFGVAGGAVNFLDTQWHFVVGTFDGTNVVLYVDGAVDTKLSAPGQIIGSSSALASIGTDNLNLGRVWNGRMAEIAIFSNALSAAQVTALYNAAQPSPVILAGPQLPPPIYEGETVTMTVSANGEPTLHYQWTSNSVNIAGATTTNLTLTTVHPNFDASYAVVVSNVYGMVTSAPAVLSVISGPPVILSQTPGPNATRFLNGSATFTVTAVGAVPITYQWQFNGAPISGATSSSLTLTALQAGNSGTYDVALTNAHGNLTSTNVVLVVTNVANNFPSAVMAMGPQAYWRLNETNGTVAHDYAGGYDGTIVGGVALGSNAPSFPGLAGTGAAAFILDGTNGVVDTPLLIDGDEGTFLALVDVTGSNYVLGILDARGGPGGSCSMELYTDAKTIQYSWYNQANSYAYAPTVAMTGLQVIPDTWCLAVVSVGEAETVIYIDTGSGLQAETNEVPALTVTNTGPLLIGRDPLWAYFIGGLSEGVYFNRALSYAEVTALDQVLFSNTPVTVPQIIVQPEPQSAYAGSSASLTVSAIGSLPLSYQWQLNNVNVPGATSQTLIISNIGYANAGSYQVVVTNAAGHSGSAPAVLTVLDPALPSNVSDGLLAHYKFDSNCMDSSGNDNDAFGVNTPTYVAGELGSAIQVVDNGNPSSDYTAVNQYVTLPENLQFNYGGAFSVAWWVNYTTPCGDVPMIAEAINSTYQAGWSFTDSLCDDGGGNMQISFCNNTGDFTAPAAYPIDDGNWHHVAVTADLVNDVALAYIDGVQITNYYLNGKGSPAPSIPIPSEASLATVDPGYPITIGNDPTGFYAGYCAAGGYTIDDMGIWGRVLAASDVAHIYSAGTNGQSIGTFGPVQLAPTLSAGQLQITWQEGTLESAPALTGPWTPVVGATPPVYVVPTTNSQLFYIIQ